MLQDRLHHVFMSLTPFSILLQDAHEFLYFLFNEISEVLEKSEKEKNGASQDGSSAQPDGKQQPPKTWVHELFQGTMVNEMRCMQCETVTSREEAFYDLSLEIENNSSVTSCLRNFRSNSALSCRMLHHGLFSKTPCRLGQCNAFWPDVATLLHAYHSGCLSDIVVPWAKYKNIVSKLDIVSPTCVARSPLILSVESNQVLALQCH